MNEKEFLLLITKALELDDASLLTMETTADDLSEWDSLGQLSILNTLDEAINGGISSVDGIANMYSLREIYNAINKNIKK